MKLIFSYFIILNIVHVHQYFVLFYHFKNSRKGMYIYFFENLYILYFNIKIKY